MACVVLPPSAIAARNGYVALLSILIVSAIAASTILVLFITSLNATLNSGDVWNGKLASALAEACAELGLQRLTNGLTTTICSGCPLTYTMPEQGSCTLLSIENMGTPNWRIRASGTNMSQSVTKYLEITAERPATGSAALLLSWQEYAGF